jgi:biotin carboxyl carrier protein
MVYEIVVRGSVGGPGHPAHSQSARTHGAPGGEESGRRRRLELEKSAEGWECRLDGQAVRIDAVLPRRDVLSLLVDGRAYEIKREQTATDLHLWVGSARFAVALRDPRSLRSRQQAGGDERGPRRVVAPMPGRIVRLLVAENSVVEAGQGIVVVEAMKMQNEIKSPKKGVVKKMSATVGAAVNPGDVLAIVE